MKLYIAISILLTSFAFSDVNMSKDSKVLLVEGNKILEKSEYLDALGVKEKSWFQFWKDDKNYIPIKTIPTISDTMRDFMDSKGFYDAKIKVKPIVDRVILNIDEGKPVIISDIEINSDHNISNIIKFEQGSRFEATKFVDIKQNIKEELMKRGYCNYDLDTKAFVDLVKRSVSLKYKLSRGKLCHFAETRIVTKPENISQKVILSRLQYRKGDVFSTERINETFDALNSLDAFGSGTVSPKENETDDEGSIKHSQIVPMEISLSSKEKFNVFKGGVGYDTALGVRLQLYYERRNFMGDARKLTSKLHYAKKSKYAEMTLFSPALIELNGDYFDFYTELGFSHNIYDAYDDNKGYWRSKLTYDRGDITVDLGMGLENIDIKKTEVYPSIIEGNFLLLYPFANFVYDGRDSKINPKNGYYFSAYTEYGLDYKPGASSYYKFLLEGRLIKTLGDLTLSAVGKAGVIDELSGVVPASKLFYAGGSYNNRAYGERDIGHITSPVLSSALGGKTWLNLSFEANYPIYDKLFGAIFFDSTMINKEDYDFKGETINSTGIGIRYLTPIGPIKLDIGANIEDIDQYGISFQIGQSF
ncbi:MAG: BamA/TamA family outer membrane protein [Sulfurovum sp.]|nr:BamA/TamA family outer membrane protein [Sulfurovum sp.]